MNDDDEEKLDEEGGGGEGGEEEENKVLMMMMMMITFVNADYHFCLLKLLCFCYPDLWYMTSLQERSYAYLVIRSHKKVTMGLHTCKFLFTCEVIRKGLAFLLVQIAVCFITHTKVYF